MNIDKDILIRKIHYADYDYSGKMVLNLFGLVAEKNGEFFCSLRAKEAKTGLRTELLDGEEPAFGYHTCTELLDSFFGALGQRNSKLQVALKHLNIPNRLTAVLCEKEFTLKATTYEDMLKELAETGLFSVDAFGNVSLIPPKPNHQVSTFNNLDGQVIAAVAPDSSKPDYLAGEVEKWKGLISQFGVKKTKDMLDKALEDSKEDHKATLETIKGELFAKKNKGEKEQVRE